MTKKALVVLMMAALAAGSAFALPEFKISLGGGAYFTSDFGGGVELDMLGQNASVKTPYYGGGGLIFLDATFAELFTTSFLAGGTITEKATGSPTSTYDLSVQGLDIGLLLKYPVQFSEQLVFFPLLGIVYRAMIVVKADGEKADTPSDFSALWFKGGGGLDYAFTGSLFLRGELLYGIRLKNTFEEDLIDDSYGLPTPAWATAST